MTGLQTIHFLHKIQKIAERPSEKSFSQALIFILGNIDEAYTMTGNYNVDVSADEFHELTKKITLPDMKKALRLRFRDEQIARLGNIHIIYPALNRKAYVGIIQLELDRLSEKIMNVFSLKTTFEQSLIDEIYKEGVYPTQGARPIFTTIHQMVKSKMSSFIDELFQKKLDVNELKLRVKEKQLICDYSKNGTSIHSNNHTITSTLEILRQPKKDELQAITAVHESGHAVISSILLNTIPELVVSITTDSATNGFAFFKNDKKFISKKEIMPKIATYLGGIVAEELVFGEENITSGSSSDISNVTKMISTLLRNNGFGSNPINYAMVSSEETDTFHDSNEIEKEMLSMIQEGKQLALSTLKKEKKLFLVLADYLSIYPRIEKDAITKMIAEYRSSEISADQSENFYRNRLKLQFEASKTLTESMEKNHYMMNKNASNDGEQLSDVLF